MTAPAPGATASTAPRIGTVALSARLTGRSVGAWLGGHGEPHRSSTLTDLAVTLTAGRGSAPTDLLQQTELEPIAAGATLRYEVPVTFKAPAFGQYTVQANFTGLGTTDSSVQSTTSTYPWALVVLAWCLLQPLLLGLYKRRPVSDPGLEIRSGCRRPARRRTSRGCGGELLVGPPAAARPPRPGGSAARRGPRPPRRTEPPAASSRPRATSTGRSCGVRLKNT